MAMLIAVSLDNTYTITLSDEEVKLMKQIKEYNDLAMKLRSKLSDSLFKHEDYLRGRYEGGYSELTFEYCFGRGDKYRFTLKE